MFDKFDYCDANYPFKFDKSHNTYQILKCTKDLIKSSKKYNSFSSKYFNMTTQSSIKMPEITQYPIIKNSEMTAITRQSFNFGSGDHNITYLTSHDFYGNTKMNVDNHTHLDFSNPLRLEDSIKKRNQSEIFQKTEAYGGLELKSKKSHISYLSQTNFDLFKNPQVSEIIWDIDNNLREINLFLKKHKKYTYKETVEVVNKKIQSIREDSKFSFEDFTSFSKNKVFRNDTKYEMSMEFKSVEIEFTNITKDTRDKFSFYIPLEILPLFYFLDIERFKFLLTGIVRFNQDYSDITVDYSLVDKMLRKMNEFNENVDRLSTTKNINEYKFDWITPNFLYEVVLKVPCVIVSVTKKNILIHKYIPSELVVCMCDQGFGSWDLYISNYLTFLKDFRMLLNKLFSLNTKNMNSYVPSNVFLDNELVKVKYFKDLDTNFSFCITKKEKNQFINFKTYEVYVKVIHEIDPNMIIEDESDDTYEFDFKLNLRKMLVSAQVGFNNYDFETLIKRLCNVTKTHVELNSHILNNFDQNLINFIKRPTYVLNTDIKTEFTIKGPTKVVYEYNTNSSEIVKNESELDELLRKLVGHPVEQWKHVLFANRNAMKKPTIKLNSGDLTIVKKMATANPTNTSSKGSKASNKGMLQIKLGSDVNKTPSTPSNAGKYDKTKTKNASKFGLEKINL